MSFRQDNLSSEAGKMEVEQSGTAPGDLLKSQDFVEPLVSQRIDSLQDLPIKQLRPNPLQPRQYFDQEALEELAQSIRKFGVVSRICVRPDPEAEGFFQIVFGERRWRAAQMAGLSFIPCEIGHFTDDELIEIGLIENIQRADLSALEEASTFRRLLDQRDSVTGQKKYSIRILAEYLGKPKNYIEEHLALLRLPEDLREVLAVQPNVSLRALIEAAKLPTPEAREPIVKQLKAATMSTEDVRIIVREVLQALGKQERHTSSLKTESETDFLAFQRSFYRAIRRVDSSLEQLREVVHMYETQPDMRKRELLSKYIQEVEERVQEVRNMLP